jgi:glucose-1-phosphate thymidylyltransferase
MTAPAKGLILAAGRGTRLLPLTRHRTKPLLPVAGQPLIAYALQKLMYDGIYDIGIVAGDNEDELRAGLRHVPAELTFIRQDEPLGLAHAVNCARDFCANDDFILLFCDNLFSEPLSYAQIEWLACRQRYPDAAAMIHTIERNDPRAFGVAVVDDSGAVIEMEEKPAHPKSNLAVIGIDFLGPSIFQAIERIQPSARGELEITDAIAELVEMGKRVQARPLTGFWFDTGTFSDMLAALKPVMDEFGAYGTQGRYPQSELSGPVGIGRTSIVTASQLTGPVMIGLDCRLENCVLGPYTAVGNGCTLVDCELNHCQVYPGTQLNGSRDSHAIIDGAIRVDAGTAPG